MLVETKTIPLVVLRKRLLTYLSADRNAGVVRRDTDWYLRSTFAPRICLLVQKTIEGYQRIQR